VPSTIREKRTMLGLKLESGRSSGKSRSAVKQLT
jgi:hypothetical protein